MLLAESVHLLHEVQRRYLEFVLMIVPLEGSSNLGHRLTTSLASSNIPSMSRVAVRLQCHYMRSDQECQQDMQRP